MIGYSEPKNKSEFSNVQIRKKTERTKRYQLAKGYYVRYSDRLNGRVVRLFYFPLVKALKDIPGRLDFLEYMSDFRYALSGEFATFASIAYDLLFPSNWGIEVALDGRVAGFGWRV